MYKIEENTGLTGRTLSVRLPESELDMTALRVLQADTPQFLVPFKYRAIDDCAVLTYMPGSLPKMDYIGGEFKGGEYVSFWLSVFEPLLHCGDWLMRSASFVLRYEHIYYSQSDNAVRYIYIPAKTPVSDGTSLKAVCEELADKVLTSDVEIERAVSREIRKMNLEEFINTLRGYIRSDKGSGHGIKHSVGEREGEFAQSNAPPPAAFVLPVRQTAETSDVFSPAPPAVMGELKINTGKAKKGAKTPKPEKAPKERRMGGLFGFGKKKDAANPQAVPRHLADDSHESPDPVGFGRYGGYRAVPEEADETEIDLQDFISGARLRRDSGNGAYPAEIVISGERFSIGRYDKVLGKMQNDIEFAENTVGVSRRHAIIENNGGAYFIVQIGEKTDTYVNGQRIPHSVPHPLNPRDRVSFNRSGADYVFEVR